MYCENYRNMSPYSSWYEEISELYRHIKYRLQEIKNNKDYRYGEFYEMRKNEYDRGQEFGLIFDQHCLLEEEIENLETSGFKVLIPPMPATAFGDKRVVFMYHIAVGLIEIVES